jgi:hypothetical protein
MINLVPFDSRECGEYFLRPKLSESIKFEMSYKNFNAPAGKIEAGKCGATRKRASRSRGHNKHSVSIVCNYCCYLEVSKIYSTALAKELLLLAHIIDNRFRI